MDEDKLLQELLDDLDDEPEVVDEPERGKAVRLMVRRKKGEAVDDASARAALTPEYNAAGSIFQLNQISPYKQADLTKLADRLEHQTQQIKDGDLGQAESMLASHAFTLEALFHNLLLRSAMNAKNNFDVGEKLMKLALKAQSQCATTLTKLAEIRNPKAYLSQTNIGFNQQVNNAPLQEEEIQRTKSKPDLKNELLEVKQDEKWLDTSAAGETVKVDSEMETVGKIDRTKIKSRQSASVAEC